MIGSTDFIDEIDCGSFFDHIDDLLDFPNDDVDIDVGLSASDSAIDAAAFPSIWTAQSESLPCSDSVFSNNTASDLSAELSVPYEDIVQLEWLSNFVEDSNCGASLTIKKQEPLSINKETSSHHDDHQFQSSSPVSVLDSSSSYSGEKPVQESADAVPGRRGRPRSKRPRPATFNPRPAIQLTENDIPHQLLIPKVSSDSESYAESRLLIKFPRQVNPEHKKKKKIKLTLPKPPTENSDTHNQSTQAVRKCMHCEITKTPQWRAGPMGPKTLCNACGVRFKSGRLFPEYRPAASPTFIPALHSNSHKKVLEMRTKIGTDDDASVTKTVTDSPEMIPNKSNPALDYI